MASGSLHIGVYNSVVPLVAAENVMQSRFNSTLRNLCDVLTQTKQADVISHSGILR